MHQELSRLLAGKQSSAPAGPEEVIGRILKRRSEYGITRTGSITGLDWIGIPVVQVVRPRSLSVVVSQGKGLTPAHAMISGLMETLEGWASERIDRDRVVRGTFAEFDPSGLWRHLGGASDVAIDWIDGIDLMSGATIHVPLGLVDTVYTIPSPHPAFLPRDTTGLAAGTSIEDAVLHGCLECLERQARCTALTMPHFFDRFQVDLQSIRSGAAIGTMEMLSRAGLLVGIWQLPTAHDLPAYWCHIMEDGSRAPFASLPGEGFACGLTHDGALTSALLEACQSRLGVISAAREDIGPEAYRYQRDADLVRWRRQLSTTGSRVVPPDPPANPNPIETVTGALELAGARAAIVVQLHRDETIPLHVVRVVAPPLETNPEIGFA